VAGREGYVPLGYRLIHGEPVTPPPDALRTLIAELLARPEDELAGTAHEIAIRIDAVVAGRYESPPEGMVATGTSWHDGAHTGCDLDYKHRHAIWQPVTPPPDALREDIERSIEAAIVDEDSRDAIAWKMGWRAAIYALATPEQEAALHAQGVVQSPDRRTGPRDRRHGRGDDLPNVHERRSQHRRKGDYERRVLLTPVDESRDPEVRDA
jgi:hypothetical protein